MLCFGHQEYGLDLIVQNAVHTDHLIFVLEIRDRAQAAHDHLRADVPCTVDQQVLERVYDDLRAGAVGPEHRLGLDHGNAFLKSEQWAFVAIDGDPDHQTIHQRAGPFDDVDMTLGDRIERAGIEGSAHEGGPSQEYCVMPDTCRHRDQAP